MWAVASIRAVDQRTRALTRVLVVAACLFGALGLIGIAQVVGQDPDSSTITTVLLVGLVLVVMGSTVFATGLTRAAFQPTVVGVAVLTSLTFLENAPSDVAEITSGVVVLLCIISLFSSLVWVTVVGSASAADRWRDRGLLRWIVLACSVLVALPTTRYTWRRSLVNAFDGVSVGYSLSSFVQLALLIVGIGWVRALAQQSPSAQPLLTRAVAVPLAVALLFRPAATHLLVPWALGVGWIMTALVLLPKKSLAFEQFSPPIDQGTLDTKIRALYQASRASRVTTDVQAELQRKVAKGDFTSQESETLLARFGASDAGRADAT